MRWDNDGMNIRKHFLNGNLLLAWTSFLCIHFQE